jgi:hypothetical protein
MEIVWDYFSRLLHASSGVQGFAHGLLVQRPLRALNFQTIGIKQLIAMGLYPIESWSRNQVCLPWSTPVSAGLR